MRIRLFSQYFYIRSIHISKSTKFFRTSHAFRVFSACWQDARTFGMARRTRRQEWNSIWGYKTSYIWYSILHKYFYKFIFAECWDVSTAKTVLWVQTPGLGILSLPVFFVLYKMPQEKCRFTDVVCCESYLKCPQRCPILDTYDANTNQNVVQSHEGILTFIDVHIFIENSDIRYKCLMVRHAFWSGSAKV